MIRPLRIGLTGGIGSGKSTVAAMFADLGVPVYDADRIVHELTAPGQPALTEIRTVFGESVFTDDNALDRAKLRQRIFSNADERRRLEEILHYRVYHALEQLTEQVYGYPYVIWIVPLLLESAAEGRVDRVLVIDCPENLQISRASSRAGLDTKQIQLIMQQQMNRSERLSRADDVLENDGDIDKAARQVRKLHRQYERLAIDRSSGQRNLMPT